MQRQEKKSGEPKLVIYTKNPKLKRRIFKSIHRYENIALKFYKKGKISKGKRYESKADRLYKKFYKKMFGIKR